MRKILSIMVICSTLTMMAVSTYANKNESINSNDNEIVGLKTKMENLYLTNAFDESEQESMKQEVLKRFNDGWGEWLHTTRELGMEWDKSDEELYQEQWGYINPKMENGLLISHLTTEKYMMLYSTEKKLNYLFDDTQYWSTNGNSWVFDPNGKLLIREGNHGLGPRFVIQSDGMDFLHNIERLEEMLAEKNEKFVSDIRLFSIDDLVQFLYLQCGDNEYLIKIHDSYGGVGFDSIEMFKLYTVEEVINSIIMFDNEYTNSVICTQKSTYDTEAEALQSAGLLQGNENGLDLLKPLTRAEAVTLLIRALGLESETTGYVVSQFVDITSDNWASPYAALAKARGIASGVSETEFAPDERVTADQFATFTLRAIGEKNFDYTEGTQILINKGIITEEQAETMDLFTRGDMAKIIYEVKEKGLL